MVRFLPTFLLGMGGMHIGIAMEKFEPGGSLPWWFFALVGVGACFVSFTLPRQ